MFVPSKHKMNIESLLVWIAFADVSDNGKGDHNKDLSKMKIGPLWAAMISFLLQSDSKSTSADTQEVETILNRYADETTSECV